MNQPRPTHNPLRLATATEVVAKPAQLVEAKPASTRVRDRLAALAPRQPIEVVSHKLVRTARLVLRPPTIEDRDEFVRVLFASREHLRGKVPVFAEPTESPTDAFARQLDRARIGDARGTAWRRVAATPKGRIVGMVMLRNIERGLTHQAEATFWTAADATRQGFAAETVDAMLRFAFMDLPMGLGVQRVTASVRTDNAACLRLMHTLGFRAEQDEHESIEIDREPHDHQRFALTAAASEARSAG